MVFGSVSIHTCISILQKKADSNEITFFEPTAGEQITSSEMESFTIKRSDLNDNWIIADQSNTSIFEKLKQGSVLLGKIARIAKGSESGNNDIFTVTEDTVKKYKIEKEILSSLFCKFP